MRRIQQIYNRVNEILHNCDGIPAVYTHLFEVSQSCALIALRRGENAELATIAGVLHDIAYLKSNTNDTNKIIGLSGNNHAEYSSKIAMEILQELNITTSEENDIICSAIQKHSDKNVIDTLFDEVLKDADVFAHGLSDVTGTNFRGVRWDNICKEFGIINPKGTNT